MLHLSDFFSSLSIGLYLIGFCTYIYQIIYGKVSPHPLSWGVWWIFSLINFGIYFDTYGIDAGIFPIGIRLLCLGVIASIGVYHFQKHTYTKMDFLCLLLAIIISIITGYIGATVAVCMMILVDFLIFLPTLQKLWKAPETEHAVFWLLAGASQLALLLSMSHFHWETAGFWIYAMCLNLTTAYIIHRRNIFFEHWTHRYKKYLSFFALKKKLW